jgi:hypothetical protein
LEPWTKVIELIEALGYVEGPEIFEHVDENYVILKRGAYFIEDTMNKVTLSVPLTEEDIARVAKVQEEKTKFL